MGNQYYFSQSNDSDTKLFELYEVFNVLEHEGTKMLDKALVAKCDSAEADAEATIERAYDIVRQIIETPAQSVRGVFVKLTAARDFGGFDDGTLGTGEQPLGNRLLMSAFEDTARLSGLHIRPPSDDPKFDPTGMFQPIQ